MPTYASDYGFLGSERDGDRDTITIYVVKEVQTTYIFFSTVVPKKGIQISVSALFLLESIELMGHSNTPISIKTDQEPAIVAVNKLVIDRRQAQTIYEESPVGSSQSNGSVENAVGKV